MSQPFLGALVQVIATLQIQVVRGQVLVRFARRRSRPAVAELRFDARRDRLRDPLLRRKQIDQRRVHGFRPDVAAGGAVDELRGDPQPLTGSADAATDDHGGLGLVAGLAWLVGGENSQRRQPRQVMDDLVAHAAAEVLEVALAAVIGERQHGDGVAADQRRRTVRLISTGVSRCLNTGA